MMFTLRQKQRARELDPECWISYSGKPRGYKQAMDARRIKTLRQAEKEIPRDIELDGDE